MQLNHVGASTSKATEKCSICREALTEQIASINGCAHRFHKDCISSWAEIANTCPLCVNRFNFIQQGRRKYKVKDKKQKNDQNDENMVDYEEIACSICHSADYSFVALLCDGCDRCYHTHCIGLDEVPDGDWFCETCKHLEHGRRSSEISNNGFRRRLNGISNVRRRPQRRRRTNNNEYDLNDTSLFSQNERNPEWLQPDDEEWRPSENESDSDYEFEEYEMNKNKNSNKNRKRKWNEIDFDLESDEDTRRSSDLIILSNNHNRKKRKKMANEKWICEQCTFENDNESQHCSMCEAKREKSPKNEKYSSSNSRESSQTNIKYSKKNRYKKKSRTKANIKEDERRQCSVNSIVGNDILDLFDLDSDNHEDDDLMLMDRNKNIKKKAPETVEKSEELRKSTSSDIEFMPKPKGRFREKYSKRYLKK